jgi:hypothetical protein
VPSKKYIISELKKQLSDTNTNEIWLVHTRHLIKEGLGDTSDYYSLIRDWGIGNKEDIKQLIVVCIGIVENVGIYNPNPWYDPKFILGFVLGISPSIITLIIHWMDLVYAQ